MDVNVDDKTIQKYNDMAFAGCPSKNCKSNNKECIMNQRGEIIDQLKKVQEKIKTLQSELGVENNSSYDDNDDLLNSYSLENANAIAMTYRQEISSKSDPGHYEEFEKRNESLSLSVNLNYIDLPLHNSRTGIRRWTKTFHNVDKNGRSRRQRCRLTPRGEQLATELFTKLATNHCVAKDGRKIRCMSFADFRSYLQWVGRPSELHILTNKSDQYAAVESWKEILLLTHCGCTEKNLIFIKNDFYGDYEKSQEMMFVEGFIEYRNMVEEKCPMEIDLMSMGLDLLPSMLIKWITFKNMFEKECKRVYEIEDFENNSQNKIHSKDTNREMPEEHRSSNIPKNYSKIAKCRWLQLTLGYFGEYFSHEQILDMWKRHTKFITVMKEFLIKNWWRSNGTQQSIILEKTRYNNMPLHRKRTYLAWFFCDRYRPILKSIEYFAISSKVAIINGFSKFCEVIDSTKSYLDNVLKNDMINSDTVRASLKKKMTHFEAKFKLGDNPVTDGKMDKELKCNLQINYRRVDQMKLFLRDIKMPTKRVGTAIVFDLELDLGTPKSMHQKLLDLGKRIFTDDFEDAVQDLPHFHSWKLILVSNNRKGEGQKGRKEHFLRLGIMFDMFTIIDKTLARMFGSDKRDEPLMSMNTIVEKFDFQTKFSTSISDLISHKDFVLDTDLQMEGSFVLKFAKDVLTNVFLELLNDAENDVMTKEDKMKEWSTMRARRVQRTLKYDPQCPTEIIDMLIENFDDGYMNKNERATKHHQMSYPFIREWYKKKKNIRRFNRLVKFLEMVQNIYLEFNYPPSPIQWKISDIMRHRLLKSFVSKRISMKSLFTAPGAVQQLVQRYMSSFQNDISSILECIDSDKKCNKKVKDYSISTEMQDVKNLSRVTKNLEGNYENSFFNGTKELCDYDDEKINKHEYIEFLSLVKKTSLGCGKIQIRVLNGTNLLDIEAENLFERTVT